MSLVTITGALAAALATSGTFTASYPTGVIANDCVLYGCKLDFLNNGSYSYDNNDFDIAFGISTITVTWRNANTIANLSSYVLEVNLRGADVVMVPGARANTLRLVQHVSPMRTVAVNLGIPATAATNNIATSQAVSGAGNLTLNGTLVTAGIAYMDVPRCWQIVSSDAGDTTQLITATGTDFYDQALTHRVTLNGTTPVKSLAAFKTISNIAVSAACTGNIIVGTWTALGLPIFLPGTTTAHVLKELQDGAAASAGTFVAGVTTVPSITTGDVRGTYIPNTAPDGAKAYREIFALDDIYLGRKPYAA